MAIIDHTINTLKELDTPSLTDVYYIKDSGKEGEWRCTSLSGNPSSENTGTILIGKNGAKYVRTNLNAVNVLWFKKHEETNWTQAIQRAVSAADEVYFPEGTYLISDTIHVSGSKRLIGSGTIAKEKSAAVFFKFLDVTGIDTTVQIEGLTFNGNTDPAQSHW